MNNIEQDNNNNNSNNKVQHHNTFCIVCPVYKPLDVVEKLSLKSLIDNIVDRKNVVLLDNSNEPRYKLKYALFFILSTDNKEAEDSLLDYMSSVELNIYHDKSLTGAEWYKKDGFGFHIDYYDSKNFKSVHTYSQLLLQYYFYKEYLSLGFDYTYLYQLDCYLFKDELQKYADLGFDYIGAPIIATNSDWGEHGSYVGNGGFSLRNNRTMMKILYRESEHWKNHCAVLENTYLPKNSDHKYIEFEDIFICRLLSRYVYINIAPIDIASGFCFDRNSDVLYERCHYNKENKETPMCCHNILNQYNWWKDFIPELESNKEIKEIAEKYQQNWETMYHPEEEGYGN